MAVKIRLRRTGCNKCVSYRVVATDERSPRDGRFLEVLGWYDPKVKGVNFKLNLERVALWRERGAQLSETVASLVRRARRNAPEAAPAANAQAVELGATAAIQPDEAAPAPA